LCDTGDRINVDDRPADINKFRHFPSFMAGPCTGCGSHSLIARWVRLLPAAASIRRMSL
jgi:hypothetical protein